MDGSRFLVRYSLAAPGEEEARAVAFGICVEQTVEFPFDLVRHERIREHIVGRVESLAPAGRGRFAADISYAEETAGMELSQLLNVIFGNTSLKPGIRVESFEPTAALAARFQGPRFGVDGLRGLTRTAAAPRPLICSAVKPMGLSVTELASLASDFAAGGVDLVKDDHGLADQAFSPFRERVAACADAIREANATAGTCCLYAPNVTADGEEEVLRRAVFARDRGAGALVISPGLAGWSSLRRLAASEEARLPVLMHPALLGGFTAAPRSGLAHGVLYGTLARLLGADASIFPSHGGRFPFSRRDCRAIAKGCSEAKCPWRPILPAPGGGITLERMPELIRFYGTDVLFLMGGGLFRHPRGLVAGCRAFRRSVGG